MASPIEDQLFNALLLAALRWSPYPEEAGSPVVLEIEGHRRVFLFRDYRALTSRIDLLLLPARRHPKPWFALAVECDGHDFHDRTKQQAAYDRARDRELLLRGVTTIRFTGSEIFHSAERCSTQTLGVLDALCAREAVPDDCGASWGG